MSAITDNGANLVLTFMPEFNQAIEEWVGARVLRIACVRHTSILINTGLSSSEGFHVFEAWVKAVIGWRRERPVKAALRDEYNVTEKVPKHQEPKWGTLGKCALFIRRNWAAVQALAVRFHQDLDYDPAYEMVLDALVPFNEFIEGVERDATTLGDAYRRIGEPIGTWDAQGTAIAATMRRLMTGRFGARAGGHVGDGVLMELAYTLQPAGHRASDRATGAARERGDQCYSTSGGSALPGAAAAVAREGDGGGELSSTTRMDETFRRNCWLGGHIFRSLPAGWCLLSDGGGRSNGLGGSAGTSARGRGAGVLLRGSSLAASRLRAAAERLISVFENLSTKQRMGSEVDLINAEMMIRIWQIYHPDEHNLPAQRLSP
jgi:hypothetical protein